MPLSPYDLFCFTNTQKRFLRLKNNWRDSARVRFICATCKSFVITHIYINLNKFQPVARRLIVFAFDDYLLAIGKSKLSCSCLFKNFSQLSLPHNTEGEIFRIGSAESEGRVHTVSRCSSAPWGYSHWKVTVWGFAISSWTSCFASPRFAIRFVTLLKYFERNYVAPCSNKK